MRESVKNKCDLLIRNKELVEKESDRVLIGNAAVNSTVAMVVAEEVAVMVCIMAATTTATASHT